MYRKPHNASIHFLILLAFLLTIPGPVFAQGNSVKIPDNAHAKRYGSGWECDSGYRKLDDACAAIKMPANSYPTNTSVGKGWKCLRGYREFGKDCVVIEIPPNAYLDSYGSKWECNRGYRKDGAACVVVKVPKNGYLMPSSFGSGWKCERGYRVAKEACVAVDLPENAHLDYSGNNWECNPPYRKQGNKCAQP